MPKKRLYTYLVFIWPQYEPYGGMNDFKDSFLLLEDAKIYLDTYKYPTGDTPCGHIVDRLTGEVLHTR